MRLFDFGDYEIHPAATDVVGRRRRLVVGLRRRGRVVFTLFGHRYHVGRLVGFLLVFLVTGLLQISKNKIEKKKIRLISKYRNVVFRRAREIGQRVPTTVSARVLGTRSACPTTT